MRRKWIQDPETNELIEVDTGYTSRRPVAPGVLPDIEPFVSHVDGTVIGSRRSLREHNRRNGVVQTLEYGNGAFCDNRAKREREEKILGIHKKTNERRKQDVIHAWKSLTGEL